LKSRCLNSISDEYDTVVKYIYSSITAAHTNKQPLVIGIGGLGGLGKSHLAMTLGSMYGKSLVVSTDGFIMERKARLKNALICSDVPDELTIKKLTSWLEAIRIKDRIVFPQYNHKTGLIYEKKIDNEFDVFIVDGAQILLPELRELLTYKIVITATNTVVKKLRKQRDIKYRGYTCQEFESLWPEYNKTYELYYRKYEPLAELCVNVQKNNKWKINDRTFDSSSIYQ